MKEEKDELMELEPYGAMKLDRIDEMPPLISLISSMLKDVIVSKANNIVLEFDSLNDKCNSIISNDDNVQRIEEIPSRLWSPICNRIMILSGLKITKKKEETQHGVIKLIYGGENYEAIVKVTPKDEFGPIVSISIIRG